MCKMIPLKSTTYFLILLLHLKIDLICGNPVDPDKLLRGCYNAPARFYHHFWQSKRIAVGPSKYLEGNYSEITFKMIDTHTKLVIDYRNTSAFKHPDYIRNQTNAGFYYIIMRTAVLKINNKKADPYNTFFCYVQMPAKAPTAVITGAAMLTVPPYSPVTLLGNQSYSNDRNSYDPLTYQWTCTALKTASKTYCDGKTVRSDASVFTLEGQYITSADKITVTFRVDQGFNSTNQKQVVINVLASSVRLQITCMLNCPPVKQSPSSKEVTYLEASCLAHCDAPLSDANYRWTIYNGAGNVYQIRPRDFVHGGLNQARLQIKSGVFKPDKYDFKVELVNYEESGEAILSLNFSPPPDDISNCVTIPNSGTALETNFTLQCSNKNISNTDISLEIFLGNSKTGDLLLNGPIPDIYSESFNLPFPGKDKFIVRFYNSETGLYGETVLNTRVNSAVTGDSAAEIEHLIGLMDKQMYENAGNTKKPFADVMKGQDAESRAKAIQTLQVVVNQLVSLGSNNSDANRFVDDLKYSVVTDLINTQLMNTKEIDRLTKTFSHLMARGNLTKTDPLMSRLATSICKKMAVNSLHMLRNSSNPMAEGERSQRVAQSLSDCVEVNTAKNYDAIRPVTIDVSTPAPMKNDNEPSVITENYANYEDFDETYYQNINNLQEATDNIINTTQVTAKIVAMTTAVGEPTKESFANKTKICVTKDTGLNLFGRLIECEDVRLLPSEDWKGDDHPYDVLMTVWTKDLMWWNQAKINVSTSILNVDFWHSTCMDHVLSFNSSVRVFLKIKQNSKREFIAAEFDLPEDYATKSNESLNKFIYVRRVTLQGLVTLRIMFHKLSLTDVFDVAFTVFKYPTYEDFTDNYTISYNDTYLHFRNTESYSVWFYLAILPNRQSIIDSSRFKIDFSLTFQLTECVKWISKNKSWEFTCKIGEKNLSIPMDDTLICDCRSFSTIAGYVKDVESIPQEIIDVEFELTFESYYLVFYTVLFLYLIYMFLILIAAIKYKVPFYFLADNRKQDRYAYILTIRTGSRPHAGTTSNVVVKLVGDKKESLPHVLNYPDPLLRILQKFNEDVFALTTRSSLGEIREIQIWFDCIGSNPDWLCRDISIYDMQTHSYCYFKIDKRFCIEQHKELTFLRAKPERNTKKTVFCTPSLQTFGLYHTWHLSSTLENMSYFKRLTMLLSKIMMIFTLNLLYYKLPTFSGTDSLDLDEYRLDFKYIIIGLTSAAIAFGAHLVLAIIFRMSKVQFAKSKGHMRCPLWITVLCWLILIVLIIICTFVTMCLGFWLPTTKSMMWLTSCTIGIFADIIIYENIVVIVMNSCYGKLVPEVDKKFSKVHKVIENQRRVLYKKFKSSVLFRPYFEHLYIPLNKKQILQRKNYYKLRKNVITDFQDLFMFGIYIMILYGVILLDRDSRAVFSKNNAIDMMNGMYTKTMSFEFSIQTIYDLYSYISSTLIPSLQSNYWYGNYVISDPALTIDMCNKFMGVVRMRQHRMKANACEVAEEMEFLNMSCWPEYSSQYKDTNDYGYSWGKFTPYFEMDRLKSIWDYKTQEEIETYSVLGEFSTYPGGGYVSLLGRTLYNSLLNFKMYVKRQWIDDKARAVFIEFLTYSVNSNLFNSVRLSLEFSATGYIFKTIRVDSTRLVYVQNELSLMTLYLFFIFVAWVALLLLRQSVHFIKKIKYILTDFWFYLDFVIIILSCVCVYLKFRRTTILRIYLDKLEKAKHNIFVSYFEALRTDEILTTMSAFLVCVATVRIWKVLRSGLIFRILEKTIVNLAWPMFSLLLVLAIFIAAFGYAGYFFFGTEFKEFYSFSDISRVVLTLFMQPAQISLPLFTKYWLGTCYFILYFILVKGLMYIFVTTIILSYTDAKLEFSELRRNYTLKSYIIETFKELPERIKSKIKRLTASGENEDETQQPLIAPKADAVRYADCIQRDAQIFNKMVVIVKCLSHIKRTKDKMTQKTNMRLMLQLCYNFIFKKSAPEHKLFYMAHLKDQKIKIIDDDRLVQMEFVTRAMLDKKHRKREVPEEIYDGIDRPKNAAKECTKIIKKSQIKMHKFEVVFDSMINRVDAVTRRIPV